ncbi:MAG TPA: aldose 1-epimerase [Baekduia sp.]|uniref:aldose 1-epimerase n=1 Tax=Baekduia sp. TaxID=2600305 RepID=UPI002D79C488|nr:aldose 1-epimerase [Baekduia sp.]HET6508373.1 aldose 1-epimerase [Baekduia sp.]
MVGVSLFGHGRELLGQLGGLDAYVARGATFGIPLLHPWANRLSGWSYAVDGAEVALEAGAPGLRTDENGLPIHGLMGAYRGWEVRDDDGRRLVAEATWEEGGERFAGFPFPHRLRLEVDHGPDRIGVTTTLTPLGDVGVPISFGFHPYFTLPGVPREELVLRTPSMTRLRLDDHAIPTGERERVGPRHATLGDAPLDAHFTDLGAHPCFTIAGGGHELTVEFLEGYTHLQLFSPPGRPIVAIEPMTAPIDALRSGEGLRVVTEPFRAAFAIDLSEAS